jgi:ribosomal protein L29
MNLQELRQKTTKEIQDELTKKRKDLEKVMSDLMLGKEKNVKKAVFIRKDIARLKTVINEKKVLEGIKNE